MFTKFILIKCKDLNAKLFELSLILYVLINVVCDVTLLTYNIC